jgi:streptogramin lyase/cytochrome c551/c552
MLNWLCRAITPGRLVRLAGVLLLAPCNLALADTFVSGEVRDLNGRPVNQAQVTLTQPSGMAGPAATTVFTDADGRFVFQTAVKDQVRGSATVAARALGYRMVFPDRAPIKLSALQVSSDALRLVLVMQPQRNHAAVAPASAWLKVVPDTDPRKALLVRTCVGCHQIAHGDMRAFVQSMDDELLSRPVDERKHSWQQLLTNMFGMSHEYFGTAIGTPYSFMLYGPEASYLEPVSDVLAKYLPERLDFVEYHYGAPLLVTATTEIREYPIQNPPGQMFNVVGTREAILAGKPLSLWVPDSGTDQIFKIEPETGQVKTLPIPFPGRKGPHTVTRGYDGQLWITYMFQQLQGKVDTKSDAVTTTQHRTADKEYYIPHDFATNWRSEVVTDTRGRLWFGNVSSNALGVTNLRTGETKLYALQQPNPPAKHGTDDDLDPIRLEARYMYGNVMTSDRKHIWYTQLNGDFGEFNTETLKYETVVEMPPGVGPRRLAITEKDILYVPLFGSGQIIEYDARTHKQLAMYDLPDRASAPYAVTWDPGRQVLWVATSNADVIYRFDPKDHSFGVLPLPRQGAYLRMVQVEPETGLLATSYGILPERAPGPRMALIIDPGDGHVHANTRRASATRAAAAAAAAASLPPQPRQKVSSAELEKISETHHCEACHSVTEGRIGPPFKAVALRYSQQPRDVAVDVLAAKILYGGSGNWGSLPMFARDQYFGVEEARSLAQAILDLDLTP